MLYRVILIHCSCRGNVQWWWAEERRNLQLVHKCVKSAPHHILLHPDTKVGRYKHLHSCIAALQDSRTSHTHMVTSDPTLHSRMHYLLQATHKFAVHVLSQNQVSLNLLTLLQSLPGFTQLSCHISSSLASLFCHTSDVLQCPLCSAGLRPQGPVCLHSTPTWTCSE